ncbi:pentapeptide repeat-containing protein [Prescottella equi]|uniref:pentapeptide repeat-containing protein n=1 Tax=Rhodococcus hoagii TaxID=43767 RepID=UPI0019DDD8C5|nr:pentapeptide repeat-containing protein [Prescottella equi]NKR75876.1 hypothetical protein [Prescottella equi]
MDAKRAGAIVGGLSLGVGALGGYAVGRVFAVPGSTEFWDVAAQPAATAFAGLGAITAGLLAYMNGQHTRKLDASHHADESQRGRESSLRERYTEAAKQLADSNAAIREAGVYAIAALADDWQRFGERGEQALGVAEQQVCVNLLCSYLRANRLTDLSAIERRLDVQRVRDGHEDRSTVGTDEAVEVARRTIEEERAVRATVLSVFRDRLNRWREHGVTSLDLSGADLSYANLAGVNLSSANLIRSDLSHSVLLDADLSDARMSRARLWYSLADGANFSSVSARNLDAQGALFSDTRFTNADLSLATLCNTRLARADLTGAQLTRANLSGAALAYADFRSAGTHLTNLKNVDMTRVLHLDEVDLSTADLTGARLPKDIELTIARQLSTAQEDVAPVDGA